MIRWLKAKLRTRRALRELREQIELRRIEMGIYGGWSIRQLSSDRACNGGDREICHLAKRYLVTKRIGADRATLLKLAGDA